MSRRVSWYGVLLHLVLLGMSIEVLLLIRENRELHQAQESAVAAVTLGEGDRLQPIAVRTLDGEPRTLELGRAGEESVLLIFTTTCPICQQNQPAWASLYERFQDRYQIVGISVDDLERTREYVARRRLPFRVVVPADVRSFPRDYRVPGVPQTVVVGSDGRIRHVWSGPLPNDYSARL